MKKRHGTKSRLIVFLLIAAVLAVFPASAPALDNDLDGFDDSYEGVPKTITTIDGFTFALDPTKKDVFVILRQAAANSLLPASDPLEYIRSYSGLAVHQIPRSDAVTTSRQVSASSTQKAVRVSEDSGSTLATGSVLGVCTYGTPNNYDEAAVYSRRIQEWIEQKSAGATSVCLGSATNCNPPTPGWLQTIKDTYVKHTIAHEAGHMMKMTKKYTSAYGGYHFRTGSGVMMDQSVYYTSKNGVVTWYIPTSYPAGETPTLK